MKQLTGFPAKMEFTPIPNFFLSAILPRINDLSELKTTLHVLAALYRKRGYPRFVTYGELLGNASLMKSLRGGDKPPDEVLRDALAMVTRRGTIIHMALDRDGTTENVYFLNTESDRRVVAKIQGGELKLSGLKAMGQTYAEVEEPPDIFTLYEQNIGMLTPRIAEQLVDAEKLYPESWIRDAIKEAINQNVRKWSYISAILERWSAEGKSDGTYQRYSKTDPKRYLGQKYDHMVRR